jgi:hypothetical protein
MDCQSLGGFLVTGVVVLVVVAVVAAFFLGDGVFLAGDDFLAGDFFFVDVVVALRVLAEVVVLVVVVVVGVDGSCLEDSVVSASGVTGMALGLPRVLVAVAFVDLVRLGVERISSWLLSSSCCSGRDIIFNRRELRRERGIASSPTSREDIEKEDDCMKAVVVTLGKDKGMIALAQRKRQSR